MIPVRERYQEPDRIFENLSLARDIASDKAKNENRTYIIWWVMDKGYVILPEGVRTSWFFASEEELVPNPLLR